MIYSVNFAPEAENQLAEIYRYTEAIVSSCESLQQFPHRGTPCNDLRSGLRLTHYKGRTVIAYAVEESAQRVTILDVFYGGQDHESTLLADLDS